MWGRIPRFMGVEEIDVEKERSAAILFEPLFGGADRPGGKVIHLASPTGYVPQVFEGGSLRPAPQLVRRTGQDDRRGRGLPGIMLLAANQIPCLEAALIVEAGGERVRRVGEQRRQIARLIQRLGQHDLAVTERRPWFIGEGPTPRHDVVAA